MRASFSVGLLIAAFVAALCPTASAGEIVELRDGTRIDAEHVNVTERHMVFHVARGRDGARKEIRVRIRDVRPASAARAWAGTLTQDDGESWLRLAEYARGHGLHEAATSYYDTAAATSEVAAIERDAYADERPAEESRDFLTVACEHHLAGRPDEALAAARAAEAAEPDGATAAMARELRMMLTDRSLVMEVAPTPRPSFALLRLERLAKKSSERLETARESSVSRRASRIASGTRAQRDVETKLQRFVDDDVSDADRARALELLTELQGQRAGALRELADIQTQNGTNSAALSTLHELMRLRPDDEQALALRARLLDARPGAAAAREPARTVIDSGYRRHVHPYPYPARGVYQGLGLVATRNPILGLGRVPTARRVGTRTSRRAVYVVRRSTGSNGLRVGVRVR